MPLNTKIGGLVRYGKDKETICLTKDQSQHIYERVESEGIVNVHPIKQLIEEDKLSKDNIDDDEINPNHKLIVNNVDKENIITSQMEQWSIPRDVVNYVQYDRNPKNFYD